MSNEVTIDQMNEVIARFMGMELKQDIDDPGFEWEWINGPNGSFWPNKTPPPFNKCWDWLMPVVEKIRGMGYHIEITISVDCSVEIIKLRGDPEKDVLRIIAYSTPINAVYTAVYQFITWYNDNQQKQNDE